MKKIILFELNEVPWRVIRDYVNDYPETTLARLLPRLRKFETFTSDKELNPWATWPTVHRGVGDEKHTIINFGQDLDEINRAFPPIWSLLSRQGIPTGLFGSFHSYPLPSDVEKYAYFVPDIFAVGSECFPKRLEAFQAWTLAMARKSARKIDRTLPLQETLSFLRSMPQLGLKPSTLARLGKQILDERREAWKKTRRRTHQVLIAFDVFEKLLRQHRPAFATFFSNHVASSMHRYWAAKYPHDYNENTYTEDWQRTYHHEIDWVMGRFDFMLGRLMAFVHRHPDYQIWVASSMGQAATRANNQASTQLYLTQPDVFMQYLGFEPDDYMLRPAMLPRVIVALDDSKRGTAFEHAVRSITIEPDFPIVVENLSHGVFRISPPVIQNHRHRTVRVNGQTLAMELLGFENSVVDDASGMTAYHIREGSLLVYDPEIEEADEREPTKIQSTDIAPMILRHFDIAIPEYMNSDVVRC